MPRLLLPLALLLALAVGCSGTTVADDDPDRPFKEPVPFNTKLADRILEKLQVFPEDNAWNQDVSGWPLHTDSDKMVASVGKDKPMRYNTDMGFVLIPPDQKKIDLKLVSYPDESDKGPYPVPDNTPIEGWPAYYKRSAKLKNTTLDTGTAHEVPLERELELLAPYLEKVRDRAYTVTDDDEHTSGG